MNYTVRLTDTANQDLREIAFQIVVKSKDRVIAKCFVGEVRETCRKLDTFPNAGGIPQRQDHPQCWVSVYRSQRVSDLLSG